MMLNVMARAMSNGVIILYGFYLVHYLVLAKDPDGTDSALESMIFYQRKELTIYFSNKDISLVKDTFLADNLRYNSFPHFSVNNSFAHFSCSDIPYRMASS